MQAGFRTELAHEDPTPANVRACVDAYGRIQPEPRGIVGAINDGGGCGILVIFESAGDLATFLRWRRDHGLQERTLTIVDASGAARAIPLTLEVGEPARAEPTLRPR